MDELYAIIIYNSNELELDDINDFYHSQQEIYGRYSTLIDFFLASNGSEFWVVCEYCVSSLYDYRMYFSLTEIEIGMILKKVLLCLEYFQKNKSILRDLKCSKIMITKNGEIKFQIEHCFSLFARRRGYMIGRPYWMAPEVIQESEYDHLSNLWCLGVVAIELAQGRPPYADIHPMRAIFLIPTKIITFSRPELWSKEFHDFVNRVLVREPKKRWNAHELLKHCFICRKPGIFNMLERKVFCDTIIILNQNSNVKTIKKSNVVSCEKSKNFLVEMIRNIKSVEEYEYKNGRKKLVVDPFFPQKDDDIIDSDSDDDDDDDDDSDSDDDYDGGTLIINSRRNIQRYYDSDSDSDDSDSDSSDENGTMVDLRKVKKP